jgi:hypothetical protein
VLVAVLVTRWSRRPRLAETPSPAIVDESMKRRINRELADLDR